MAHFRCTEVLEQASVGRGECAKVDIDAALAPAQPRIELLEPTLVAHRTAPNQPAKIVIGQQGTITEISKFAE